MSLAEVIPLRSSRRMQCSSCGASATAACDCGAPYVPAGQRVAEYDAANPGKSTRDAAMALGISKSVIHEARQKPGVRGRTGETVTGKDGKKYKATKPKKAKPKESKPFPSDPIQEDCSGCRTDEERWQHSLGSFAGDAVSMRAFWKREFGEWQKFAVPSSLKKLAAEAAKAWKEMAAELKERKDA